MHPFEPRATDQDKSLLMPSFADNRMRRLATGMLITMLAVLVLANVFLSVHPSMGYLRAFAEAAVVGALADWFAVTALFRQPLGLPIPHTAIIPRNKERIGASLGRFVELNFASPEVVSAKLARVDLSGNLAQWLSDSTRTEVLADHMTRLIPQLLDSIEEHQLRRFISGDVSKRVQGIDLAPLIGEAVAMLSEEKRHQVLLDKLLRETDDYITANEQRIRERVRENTAWLWQRLSIDSEVADNVILVLRELLAEIARDSRHPLRLRLDSAIEKLVSELATSPEYRKQIAVHTRKLLNQPALHKFVATLWRDIRISLHKEIGSADSTIKALLREATQSATRALLRDTGLRERLNDWMRNVVVEAVQSHQRDVGSLIADTVRGWDTETVTRRIEQQVGEDLQYIRINGTMIGGLVGLAIYTISRAFG
ncbi:Uncharacterized membrane-anchored protein YjiN, DUF445 family [Nitrosospira briensis]|uniref:Uncharacterized membrane-anchored protein YjiN, DUF445 family n=2 Tax=Nitrosospira briensis TaxID=35799 RepID=A0A1I5E9B4_9PROT|nr:Uncharacterized membrane-anchored protein YjiN, DUF445 family [Nitrosospira briensis]